MGRSVSYPSNAIVTFKDVSHHGYECDENGEHSEEHDEFLGQIDWDDFIYMLKEQAIELWPTLEAADAWIGNENHILASNQFAHFGVSEYCGLASVWIAPNDDCEQPELAKHWMAQVEAKFMETFGEYKKVATFSNGEGVYEKV